MLHAALRHGPYDPRVARAALLSVLLAACGAPPAPARDDTRHERVAVAGDPAVGTVYFIREIHGCAPEALPQLGTPRQQERIVDAVLRYQLALLEELERSGVRDVFADGVGAAYVRQHLAEDSPLLAQAREAFRERPRSLEALSPMQTSLLFQLGAPFVYAARNREVTVHETEDDAAFHRFFQSITVEHPELAPRRREIADARERAIAEHVMALLRERPGAEVTLVLGREHTMSDDFIALGAPRVVAIHWGRASLPMPDVGPLPPP